MSFEETMYEKGKKYSVEISESGCLYFQFSDDDFAMAEERAEEFVEKALNFSASIYDAGDLVETIMWDENREEIVYILSYYGRLRGFRIVPYPMQGM
jgi:hypothetical protein